MWMTRGLFIFVAATSLTCPVWSQDATVIDRAALAKATPEQAKSFIINMIEQHSASSCSETDKDLQSEYEHSTLAKIDGNRIVVQVSKKEKTIVKEGSGFMTSIDSTIKVYTALLSELTATAGDAYDHRPSACGIPATLSLVCKQGQCVKRSSQSLRKNDAIGVDGTGYKDRTGSNADSTDGIFIDMNNAAVAHRVVNAITFYQEKSPEAAPSPF